MDPRLRRAAWPALAVLGVLLAFAPATVGLRTLARRDTDRIYAPLRTLVVEALRDLRLPLWNPYEGTGKPLFAEGIHSVLHPLSLLGAAVAPGSIDFLIIAYLVAASLGAFVLARALAASPPASAGAGLAFALSGYSVSMTGNLVFLAGLSTLPWLLAAARLAGRGHRWGVVLTALATASAFFSGDVQVALVGLALGLALAADAGGLRGALRTLAGFATGILLASVQLLASWKLLPLTERSLDLAPAEKVAWALLPARLVEWIVPGLLRGPLDVIPRDLSGAPIPPVFAESVYLGAPLLVAAALGLRSLLATGRRRSALLLVGAAAVLLWLAFGHHLGATQLFDWVPVWSRFRYAEKLMAPLTLVLCVLGALGVDSLGSSELSSSAKRALIGAGVVVAAILLWLWLAPEATTRLAARLGDAGPFHRARLAAGLPHLLAALLALLALDGLREARHRVAAFALLVAGAPAAGIPFGAHFGSPEAHRFATPLRLEADLAVARLAHPEAKTFERAPGLDYVEVNARTSHLLLFPPINAAHRVDSIEPYGAFESRRLSRLAAVFGDTWATSFRRFGLTHLAMPLPEDQPPTPAARRALRSATLVQRDEERRFELWGVPHRPWAFFASRALPAASPADALAAVVNLTVLGDDSAVAVETADPAVTSPGRVLAVARGRQSLRIEAEADGPGLLVVQDAFWPGWRADVDGQPAEILAADSLVRAVRFPGGRHALRMSYEPPEIRLGLALGVAGLLLVAALSLRAVRRPR